MLTFEQLKTIWLIRVHAGTFFSNPRLDNTTFKHIISFCDADPYVDKALLHAAYARKEDVDALLAMLEVNPRLLLQPGKVITSGGLEVQRVTIYEFILGAGDLDLAGTITPFFARMPGGETERLRQLERYRPHLDGMLTQVPYDIRPIFNLLLNPVNKVTIHADVNALLANDPAHKSQLGNAIMEFRNAHIPTQPLIKPRMHFNYATQNELYQTLYDDEIWSALYAASGNNYNMIDLIWLKMICYLMNFYPGIDRCITAQGIGNVYNEVGNQGEEINRSYKLRHNAAVDFPDFGGRALLGLLGEHFGISLLGWGGGRCGGPGGAEVIQAHCRAKASKLPSIYAATPAANEAGRVCDFMK